MWILINKNGTAHVRECGHLNTTKLPGNPTWGWIPDATQATWDAIPAKGSEVTSTHGTIGLRATVHCHNCYPGMPGEPQV